MIFIDFMITIPQGTIRMNMSEYFSPLDENQAKTMVKGSRFIGRIVPVKSRDEAERAILRIKDEFKDAAHNCWAYRIFSGGSEEIRFSDEGEPSGTAGKPILESLKERNIGDSLLVVTRYFGGIKLGMGGLSRAYRDCARQTIAGCRLQESVETAALEMCFPYSYDSPLRILLQRMEGRIDTSHYQTDVRWVISIPESRREEFTSIARDICRGEVKIGKYKSESSD